MDEWRHFLYPLGFLASLLFTARSLIQWLKSESKKESLIPPLFWQISLAGNIILLLHSFIQIQYHVFIIQIGNGFIAWRNLNLMKSEESQVKLRNVLVGLIFSAVSFTFLFAIFNELNLNTFLNWFQTPTYFFKNEIKNPIDPLFHLLGFLGLALFSSRFWVQWILAEKKKKSSIGKSFWWISLVGGILILLYFAKIKDPVNLIGPLFGLIPCIRNLYFLQDKKAKIANKLDLQNNQS